MLPSALQDSQMCTCSHQVCIKRHLCGLATPRSPTEHFTPVSYSSGDVYLNDQHMFRPEWCYWETLSWRPTVRKNLLRSFVRSRGRLAVMTPVLGNPNRDPHVGPGLHKQTKQQTAMLSRLELPQSPLTVGTATATSQPASPSRASN